MLVGINYPSSTQMARRRAPVDSFGWDFGPGPQRWGEPAWRRRAYAADPTVPVRGTENQLQYDLRVFHGYGLRVVRWFVLPDGLTYGHRDPTTGHSTAPQPVPGGWSFDPPPLPARVLEDFTAVLATFQQFNRTERDRERWVLLMPCLISYDFFRRPGPSDVIASPRRPGDTTSEIGHVKGGRWDTLYDARKRDFFLDSVLGGLLRASSAYREQIYAWDVMNEPEWATAPGYPLPAGGQDFGGEPDVRTVSWPAMQAFLSDAVARVNAAGFRSTIGFAKYGALLAWSVAPLRFATTIDQFHWYGFPRDAQDELPRKPAVSGRRPMIVGEMTSHPAGPFDSRRYFESSTSSISFNGRRSWISMRDRLDFVHCVGRHDGALLWDAARRPESARPPQDRLLSGFWDVPAVREDVSVYTKPTFPACTSERSTP